MSISPVNFSRYSNLVGSDSASGQINSVQQQLLTVQRQISTGNRINDPSDDPGASGIVIQLQKSLTQQTQYLSNVQQSQSQLGEVDSQLGNLTDLVTQATTIASQNVGSTATASQRAAAAAQVQALYDQALSIGNTKFEGAYIFGGTRSNQQPFVAAAGGVQFMGSTSVLQNTASNDTLVPFQVSAADVFGAMSSQATGTADLTPSLTASTRISDLGGATGGGVHLGTIQLGNGTTTVQVDLSHADTIQDVVNSINNAGLGNITASANGNHLVLATGGADNITVSEVGGGDTAASLGILHPTGSGAGVSVVGASIHPKVTALTPLTTLNNGAGIDTVHGLKITNGQTTVTVNLSTATTVGDLVNAINASGARVQAQVNSAGTGINIANTVQGTEMTIGENGGTTAADLGVRTFSPATRLADLNGGQGLGPAAPGGDFQITRSDGSSFTVSLAGATTVGDAINAINTAAAGAGVAASFSTNGNGIVLTDTAGGAGTLTVTPLNFSTAAAGLGITTPAVGNVITGSDANPVEAQGLFSELSKLQQSLQNNDSAGITQAAQGLDDAHTQIVSARGHAGAQVQELQSIQSSIQAQNTSTQALISQIQGADMPATIQKFTELQTALQASLQVTAKGLHLSLLDFLT